MPAHLLPTDRMDIRDLEPTPPTIDPTPRPYPRAARRAELAVEDAERGQAWQETTIAVTNMTIRWRPLP